MTMSVNGTSTNGISPFTTNFSEPTATSLSPEGLLYYCSSRLDALNTNIQQYFVEQQRMNTSMAEASKLIEVMNYWAEGQNGWQQIEHSPELQMNHAAQGNNLLGVYKTTTSPEIKRACAEAFARVTGLPIEQFASKDVTPVDIAQSAAQKKIPIISLQQHTANVDAVKSKVSNMQKSAEMNMIQLQSLVSQRQQAVQLTTQLLQSLNETSKQVVGNIR